MKVKNIKIQKIKINETKIEFKDVKERMLKRFYVKHFNDLFHKITTNQQNEYNNKEKENRIEDIINECKAKNYVITDEDKEMFNNMKNQEGNNDIEVYIKYMFYSKKKKSINLPHIKKLKILNEKILSSSIYFIIFFQQN